MNPSTTKPGKRRTRLIEPSCVAMAGRRGRPPSPARVVLPPSCLCFFSNAKNVRRAENAGAERAGIDVSAAASSSRVAAARVTRGVEVRGRERRIVTRWSFLGHKPSFATTRP